MLYKRLSSQKAIKVLLYFCEDITVAAAKLVKVNRKTVNKYYNDIREKILDESLKEMPRDNGTFEVDEFRYEAGTKKMRTGAAGKTPVFGLPRRSGKLVVKIVKNCPKEELMPVMQGKNLEKSAVYPDGWKAYDRLIVTAMTITVYSIAKTSLGMENPL
jgi:transposase